MTNTLNKNTTRQLKQILTLSEIISDDIRDILKKSKKFDLDEYNCTELASFERLTLELRKRSLQIKKQNKFR